MSGRYEKEQKLETRIECILSQAPAVLTDYYYHLSGAGRSYTTIYRYINYILTFLDFTYDGKYAEDFYLKVRPAHINRYIASLRTKEVDGKTERASDSIRGVQWSALNSFFQFLVPEYIPVNPVEGTKRPQIKDNPNVTYLTTEEIKCLLDYVSDNAQGMFRNRDLCILKLGFSTGLRVSAITQIDINDIDFVNNQIRVTEKGDYDDYIMFGDNLKSQLLLCIEDRKKYFNSVDSNALFISRQKQRITETSVARMIEKYAKAVTNKKVTPHVMRHSCATNLYEQTKDIYLCAKQLRHKNVTTTQRYAELSKERQKAATNILDNLI
jgi:site-specific recombinase XerD